jgi:hypothetical protein
MTSILGLLTKDLQQDVLESCVLSMTKAAGGQFLTWQAPDVSVGLAASGQQLLDLTPDGRQPAVLPEKRFAAVLNGYIANGAALRRELEELSCTLQGHSDAELLCEATAQWGLNRLLQKLEGAFAFALWDGHTNMLHLVRDRMGARPLFVYATTNMFAFASDVKAFEGLPGFEKKLNKQAVLNKLAYGYIQAPLSFYEGVLSVPAGNRLMLSLENSSLPAFEAWWSPATTLEEYALCNTAPAHYQGRVEKLRSALVQDAIRLDVGFGLLDDGGNDVRVMLSVLEKIQDKPFKTYKTQLPDAVDLQKAFDALALSACPYTDPAAILWWHCFQNVPAHTPVLLQATGMDYFDLTVSPKKPDFLSGLLSRLMPVFKSGQKPASCEPIWPDLSVSRLDISPPRIDMLPEHYKAYTTMCGAFFNEYLPDLYRVASDCGVEIRVPWADRHMLEFGLPRAFEPQTDIALWLRGPLRIRAQNLLTERMFDVMGIKNGPYFLKIWQGFLEGDNTHAQRLWLYVTLAAWVHKKVYS